MNELRINGIIINQTDHLENDVILAILTDTGIYNVIAKGVKKYKSKNKGLASLYVYGEFDLSRLGSNSRYLLKTGKIIDSNQSLFSSIEIIAILEFVCELIIKDFYRDNLLSECLNLIKEVNADNLLPLAWVLKRMIEISGTAPVLDNCFSCGNKRISSFNLSGGFVCHNCQQPNSLTLSVNQYQLLRYLFKAEKNNYQNLKKYDYDWVLIDCLVKYYLYHHPQNCNSWIFLKQLYLLP